MRSLPLAIAAGFAFGALLGAASAGAATAHRTITIRFYSKVVVSREFSSSGKPLASGTRPARGDYTIAADDDYAGTFKSHSKRQIGSDFLRCVFENTTAEANCAGVITIGNSLIYLVFDQNFTKFTATSTFAIRGGTGIYAGATGTVVSGATSNFVVRLTTG